MPISQQTTSAITNTLTFSSAPTSQQQQPKQPWVFSPKPRGQPTEDHAGGFSFGTTKPTTQTLTATKSATTSVLFAQLGPHLMEDHVEGFRYGATKQAAQTMPFNQEDYELYDNRLATFAFWPCSDLVNINFMSFYLVLCTYVLVYM